MMDLDSIFSFIDCNQREKMNTLLSKTYRVNAVIYYDVFDSVRNSVLDTTFDCTDLQIWPKDNSQYIVATTSTVSKQQLFCFNTAFALF